MNWMLRISQRESVLSVDFEIPTQKIGPVQVSIKCSFDEYDRWYNYKHGAGGWNDRHVGNQENAINMEPDCELYISHLFSEMMPRVEKQERNPYEQDNMDAFDMIDDEMTNLENDDFHEIVKIRDLSEKIQQWLFKPNKDRQRRVHQEEIGEVTHALSTEMFGVFEELFQQYTTRTKV